MTTWVRKPLFGVGLLSGVVVAACLSTVALAETRSLYDLTYAHGHEVGLNLDSYRGFARLQPGFSSATPDAGNNRYQLGIATRSAPSFADPVNSDHGLDITASYLRRIGNSGFGYSFDLGLGLYGGSSPDDALPVGHFSQSAEPFVLSQFSTGPTFESGNLSSRMRVGVRAPALGDSEALNPSFLGHRGDLSRSAGYVSLDGRYRFGNQTEMSLSVFLDDFNLSPTRDRVAESSESRLGSSLQPVFGLEMGLNF